MRLCPECGAEISHVRYTEELRVLGTYHFDGQTWDEDDSDTLSMDYSCPECESGLSRAWTLAQQEHGFTTQRVFEAVADDSAWGGLL